MAVGGVAGVHIAIGIGGAGSINCAIETFVVEPVMLSISWLRTGLKGCDAPISKPPEGEPLDAAQVLSPDISSREKIGIESTTQFGNKQSYDSIHGFKNLTRNLYAGPVWYNALVERARRYP